ncbi:MAG: polysaccharide deacetylase family protein [Oleiphilus sp.]
MNKRRLLSMCLSRLGLLPFLRKLGKQSPSLKILAYHRVMDIDENNYLFDEHLVDSTIADFEQQMKYLSQHFRVLPLTEAYAEFQRTEDPNIVAVTFDDGFDDLYMNVFPIVKKYQIKPTMFLTTGLIGTNTTLWTEELVFALKSNLGQSLRLECLNHGEETLIDKASVSDIIKRLLLALKKMPDEQRHKTCSQVKQQLGVSDVQHSDSKMLNWEMVQEMSEWGIEFGSHSVKHSILTNLSHEEMLNELKLSKSQLETELSKSCKTLAYPVGGAGAFNQSVIEATKEAGYEVACSYLSGVVGVKESTPLSLKRLHIDSSVDMDWFKGMLSMPEYLAANFISD